MAEHHNLHRMVFELTVALCVPLRTTMRWKPDLSAFFMYWQPNTARHETTPQLDNTPSAIQHIRMQRLLSPNAYYGIEWVAFTTGLHEGGTVNHCGEDATHPFCCPQRQNHHKPHDAQTRLASASGVSLLYIEILPQVLGFNFVNDIPTILKHGDLILFPKVDTFKP